LIAQPVTPAEHDGGTPRLRDNASRSLLMLAYYFPPDNESGALRPLRFCRFLPAFGYNTHVVSASAKAADARLVSRALELAQRHLLPYNDLLPWVPRAVRAAESIIAGSGAAAILSTSPPVATHIAALHLKRRYRLPWIADFRDPLVGNPYRTRRAGVLYDKVVERSVFHHADAIVANTDTAGEAFRTRYPQWAHKIHVIWNGYDPNEAIEPAPPKVRPRRVLAHAGSLYRGRHPGALLACIDRLILNGRLDPSTILIELVGYVDRNDAWANSTSYRTLQELGCLQCDGQVIDRACARQITAEADYLLLLDLNELNTSLQVPAKVFEYVQVARPILLFTSPGSPAEQILAGSGVPYTSIYNQHSPDEVDDRVLTFLARTPAPVRITDWFRDQFDSRQQTRILASLLDGISGSKGS
jgi:glycosyltransferase involved in cell wall biosynthesis